MRFISASFIRSSSFFSRVSASVSGGLVSSSFTSTLHKDLGGFEGNFTSNKVEYLVPSQSAGGSDDVKVLVISASGDNPRVGIGVENPLRSFDFKEIRDDDRGGEILIRGSRSTKGAENNDEVGRINFAIDSSSFSQIDTSGSAAEIVATVDDVDVTGVQGSLSLRVAAAKKSGPLQRIKLIGNPSSPAIEFTGSAEFDTNVDIIGNVNIGGAINSLSGDITASNNISASGTILAEDYLLPTAGGALKTKNNGESISITDDNIDLGFGGSWQLEIRKDEGVVLYDLANVSPSLYKDFRIEGNSDTHLFFVTGGDARIGIGTSTPEEKLTVQGNISASGTIIGSNLSGTNTGDQDLSSYSTIVQLNASSSALQTNIDTKVDTSGTPANNQIAIFTDSDTIEGDSDLTWNGSTFTINGTGSVDLLQVDDKLQGNGSGFQFFAFNEDTIKVKFANWYSSNDRQYGMGQLWYETWFAAIDNQAGRDNRRIGFYLEEPDAGSTDSGTPGQHPSNARFYVDINGAYLSGSLNVESSITGSDVTISDWGSVSSSLATLDSTTLQDVTDNGSTTTNNITIDSTGDARLVLDRAANANDSEIEFKTNGTTNWSIGTGQIGSDADFTFKGQDGSNYIRINQSGQADFLSAVTSSDVHIDDWGSVSASLASVNEASASFSTRVTANDDKLTANTSNVTSAGALMDSEVTNLAQVKAFDSSDYATAAQGTKADNAATLIQLNASSSALQTNISTNTGNISTNTTNITSLTDTVSTVTTVIGSDAATNVDTFATSTYNGAIYDYILKDSTVGARAGQFMVAHDNGDVTFTDTSTRHLSDSTIPEITADISGGSTVRVRVTNGNGYTFKSFVKKI